MTKETRNALLSSLLLHLEAACETLRALMVDELEVAPELPPAPAAASLSTSPPPCPHPADRRRALATLGGGGAGREMCRVCGQILENGQPVLMDAPAGGGS